METLVSAKNKIKIGGWKKTKQQIVVFDLVHVNEALKAHKSYVDLDLENSQEFFDLAISLDPHNTEAIEIKGNLSLNMKGVKKVKIPTPK